MRSRPRACHGQRQVSSTRHWRLRERTLSRPSRCVGTRNDRNHRSRSLRQVYSSQARGLLSADLALARNPLTFLEQAELWYRSSELEQRPLDAACATVRSEKAWVS